LVAALLRSGQCEVLAQGIEQRGPRIEIQRIASSVDRETYVLARQRSSLRHRLAHRGWRRERQSCGPGGLEKATPGRHGSKLSKSFTTLPPCAFAFRWRVCPRWAANYQRALSRQIDDPAVGAKRQSRHVRGAGGRSASATRRRETR